jgi:rhodanese-related sulfurtransferase
VALGWSASDLAGLLYESLRTKLLTLPDDSLVYPAHGAGSLCGKALSKETVSTIGEQRRLNYALQPMTKAAFVEMVTADQPDAPPYFTYDAILNSRERPTLDEALARELNPLSLDQVLALKRDSAQVLDTRDPGEFAAAHLAGSLNVGLGGQYATWAGTILSRERPIVIVAAPGHEQEAALRLGRIGFDHIAGYLADGLQSLDSRPDLTAATERLSPALAADRLGSAQPPVPVDVRTPQEHQEKRIAGSLSMPLNHLAERLHELPRSQPLLVYCAGGYRSSIAASVLQEQGFDRAQEIAGGLTAWEAAGLPVERGRIN